MDPDELRSVHHVRDSPSQIFDVQLSTPIQGTEDRRFTRVGTIVPFGAQSGETRSCFARHIEYSHPIGSKIHYQLTVSLSCLTKISENLKMTAI